MKLSDRAFETLKKTMHGRKKLSLAAVLVVALSACGREGEAPKAPPTTPRPTTFGGQISHALLDLSARPVPPPPGQM